MIPQSLMQNFIAKLRQTIEQKRLITDPLLCYAHGTDASMYRMTPKLVILAKTDDEIKQIILIANEYNISLTFRAAGTSLSGQAVTDQVLVVLDGLSWQTYKVHDQGLAITLEPGIIASHANLYLKPYQTKIGPDPASMDVCKIGGIVANNSSGMCCGTSNNTYQTMRHIKCILANGSTLDTSSEHSRNTFAQNNSGIIHGITQIRDLIAADHLLTQLITHKFKIKNTCGYNLNAFVDYHDPIDILAHLMIGSEGTLGFISAITYNCIADDQYKSVSLVYCKDLLSLINLVLLLDKSDVSAMELLDISSLVAIQHISNNRYIPMLETDTAAMLIELSSVDENSLRQKIENIQKIIDGYDISHQIHFTTDKNIAHDLWALRKGILPIIGGNRPPFTTVIIEDIAVQLNDLPNLAQDLRLLFNQYNYTNAAIFGHILAGNIHFVFTPSFNTEEHIENYKKFMQSMTTLVISKYHGSLKAEHGTGRNIAPFVELEWGSKAYKIMWQIKSLLDPNHILNKDVILSHDPHIHLKHLKKLDPVNPKIDKCIECGFCEIVCPSKNLSLTPRQRISSYRYLNTLKTTSKSLYKKLYNVYKYIGVDTCATTGLCKHNCPVGINTGEFILELNSTQNSWLNKLWAKHFNWFVVANRNILNFTNIIAQILGKKRLANISSKLHKTIPILPVYPISMPQSQKIKFNNNSKNPDGMMSTGHSKAKPLQSTPKQKIIYIPSCNNRIFADTIPAKDTTAITQLLGLLNYEIIFPKQLNNLCCGQVFTSQGNNELAKTKQDELCSIINFADYPVLIDNSSCFKHILANIQPDANIITIIDVIFNKLEQLNLTKRYNKLALHVDCSSKNQDPKILKILEQCANQIIIPQGIYCCGFAGNKGFTLPELNQSALSTLATQIKDCDIGVTFNRNCQIGLSQHGKKTYVSLAEIVLQCIV